MSTTPVASLDTNRYAELLGRTLPRVVRSEEEHERLVTALLQLDEQEVLSPEEDELAELLTMLVTQYEQQHYPIEQPTPSALIAHLLEARGLMQQDVASLFNTDSEFAAVCDGTMPTTKLQARKLAEFFHVSEDLFLPIQDK